MVKGNKGKDYECCAPARQGNKIGDCGVADVGYPSDCELLDGLRKRSQGRLEPESPSYVWRRCLPLAAKVKLLLLDVDGVLTDSALYFGPAGFEAKSFSSRDGFGIRLLQEAGVETGIITARSSEAVKRRAENLGLRYVFQGASDKLLAFQQILAEQRLDPSEVAYMGDDWLDLPLMVRVGLSATVADAEKEVRSVASFISTRPAGRGAVRELCMLIIDAKGDYKRLLARYCPEHPFLVDPS